MKPFEGNKPSKMLLEVFEQICRKHEKDAMKPKRRYHTLQSILNDIDRARASQKSTDAECLSIEQALAALKKQDTYQAFTEHGELSRRLSQLRRRLNNIENNKLPYLKRKLAEFQTQPIPGILPDESIPA